MTPEQIADNLIEVQKEIKNAENNSSKLYWIFNALDIKCNGEPYFFKIEAKEKIECFVSLNKAKVEWLKSRQPVYKLEIEKDNLMKKMGCYEKK